MVSSHAIVLMWEKLNWEKNESKTPFADFGTLHHHSVSHDLLKFYEAGSDTLTTTSLGFVRADIYGCFRDFKIFKDGNCFERAGILASILNALNEIR